MRWSLNSSRPAPASGLAGVLEEALAEHLSARRVELARNIVAGVQPQEVTPLHERAERQMRAAIAAAVTVAEGSGGSSFLVSLSGVVDEDEEVTDRLAVYVDVVP
jgi:hypothetical protein